MPGSPNVSSSSVHPHSSEMGVETWILNPNPIQLLLQEKSGDLELGLSGSGACKL